MAYTYDDFLNAANKSGMLPEFSQEDLEITQRYPEYGLGLLTLRQDASKASTPEGKLLAQESENQLRKTYSTVVGDKQTPGFVVGQTPTTGSQVGAGQTTQQPTLEGVGNTAQVTQGSFQYNPEEDPRFIAYKKAYLREGDRAAENALAKASALTGGIPSTAAITASQQAGDYYAGKLADIIPELYSDAYSQHVTEQQLQADREQQKIANALSLYKTLGYATPEIAEILGLQTSNGVNTGGTLDGNPDGNPNDKPGVKNWDNGNYTEDAIKILQNWLGVEADGMFGPASKAALEKRGYSSLEQVMLEQPWLEPAPGGSGGGGTGGSVGGTQPTTETNGLNGEVAFGPDGGFYNSPEFLGLPSDAQAFILKTPGLNFNVNSGKWKSEVGAKAYDAYVNGELSYEGLIAMVGEYGLIIPEK